MTINIIIDDIGNDRIKKAVKENEGYCPCNIAKNDNTKCMCSGFMESIRNKINDSSLVECTLRCHCGLYRATIKKEN